MVDGDSRIAAAVVVAAAEETCSHEPTKQQFPIFVDHLLSRTNKTVASSPQHPPQGLSAWGAKEGGEGT